MWRRTNPFSRRHRCREVPHLYAKMSPFWYADNVKDPILLMHGEADDNSGTFPSQSECFYMALKGRGRRCAKHARIVVLECGSLLPPFLPTKAAASRRTPRLTRTL